MLIYDPIYGRFETPPFLDEILSSPEVRRLSEIRLLNASTPSLATLGEIRRYSHTLGVVYLCLQNPHFGLSESEVKALLASVLVHDAGTPPFAHLLEYYLDDKFMWSHEGILPALLTGNAAPENAAHQVYRGIQICFRKLCERANIDFGLVLKIVKKEEPISKLIFGSLDFDNLDNVIRMAWALGLSPQRENVLLLASKLSVRSDGMVLLERRFSEAVEWWAKLRRQVYSIIVFDEPTSAAQAVLSRAIRIAIHKDTLQKEDWSRFDEDLIRFLSGKNPEAKDLLRSRYLGQLPECLFVAHAKGKLSDFRFSTRDQAAQKVEEFGKKAFGIDCLGFVFVDRGAFEKRLEFADPRTNESWVIGKKSESVVFYCFEKTTARLGKFDVASVAENFLKEIGANPDFEYSNNAA